MKQVMVKIISLDEDQSMKKLQKKTNRFLAAVRPEDVISVQFADESPYYYARMIITYIGETEKCSEGKNCKETTIL